MREVALASGNVVGLAPPPALIATSQSLVWVSKILADVDVTNVLVETRSIVFPREVMELEVLMSRTGDLFSSATLFSAIWETPKNADEYDTL